VSDAIALTGSSTGIGGFDALVRRMMGTGG
jgi:hypothetical protein